MVGRLGANVTGLVWIWPANLPHHFGRSVWLPTCHRNTAQPLFDPQCRAANKRWSARRQALMEINASLRTEQAPAGGPWGGAPIAMRLSLLHVIVFAAIIAISFAPAIIAFVRNHAQKWIIFALNVILGWTGVGWIAVLIWSIIGKSASTADDLADTFS